MSAARARIWLLAFGTASIVAVAAACVYVLGPASDAVWYLGAGERLNAGHLLYALSAGDRPILLQPPFYLSPFLYPPSFAIVWRPLAAFPDEWGLWAWWAAVILAMAVWLIGQLRASGIRMALAVLLLAFPMGQTFATANLNGLVMVAFGLGWIWRDRARPLGLMIGTLAAWKLFPGVLLAWMLVTRRWAAAAWTLGTMALWSAAGLVLVGPEATMTYIGQVLPTTEPMGISVGYLSGLPLLGYAAALIGLAAAWLLRRQAATSYAISTLTAIVAWPSLGIASLSILIGAAPSISETFHARGRRGDALDRARLSHVPQQDGQVLEDVGSREVGG